MLFLVVVINFLCFFYAVFEYLYWCILTIIDDTYIQYILYDLKPYASSLVYFVLWSICWNSSFIHFKNKPEYLTRLRAQDFIPLMRSRLQSLMSRSFILEGRQMRFQIVYLSILSLTTLCLKNTPIGNDTLHPGLLSTVGLIHWKKIAWVLATKSYAELSINN